MQDPPSPAYYNIRRSSVAATVMQPTIYESHDADSEHVLADLLPIKSSPAAGAPRSSILGRRPSRPSLFYMPTGESEERRDSVDLTDPLDQSKWLPSPDRKLSDARRRVSREMSVGSSSMGYSIAPLASSSMSRPTFDAGYSMAPSPSRLPGSSSPLRRQSNATSIYSNDGSPRRPSILLHELHLQPTSSSRPLSPHQMLLLTPFGKPLPLPSTNSRTPSPEIQTDSLPRAPQTPASYARKRGSAPFLSRPRFASVSPLAPPTPAPPISHATRLSPRFNNNPFGISTSPRIEQSEDLPEAIAMPVPMTRSLSLPILTLRELDAMREKEEALGIVRDHPWTWVSGGVTEESDDEGSRRGSRATASPSSRLFFPMSPPTQASPPVFADPFRRSSQTSFNSDIIFHPRSPASSVSAGDDRRNSVLGPLVGPTAVVARRPSIQRYNSSPANLGESFKDAYDIGPTDTSTVTPALVSSTDVSALNSVTTRIAPLPDLVRPLSLPVDRRGSWASVRLYDNYRHSDPALLTPSDETFSFDSRPRYDSADGAFTKRRDSIPKGLRRRSSSGVGRLLELKGEEVVSTDAGWVETHEETVTVGPVEPEVVGDKGQDWWARRGSWGEVL